MSSHKSQMRLIPFFLRRTLCEHSWVLTFRLHGKYNTLSDETLFRLNVIVNSVSYLRCSHIFFSVFVQIVLVYINTLNQCTIKNLQLNFLHKTFLVQWLVLWLRNNLSPQQRSGRPILKNSCPAGVSWSAQWGVWPLWVNKSELRPVWAGSHLSVIMTHNLSHLNDLRWPVSLRSHSLPISNDNNIRAVSLMR